MWRGERRLFADLNVAVCAGRVLHVRGANGFGKTTLLRILCGLMHPEEGSLELDGESFPSAHSRAGAVVGYLGHIDGLKMDLDALENLRFAAAISGSGAAAGELAQPRKEPSPGDQNSLDAVMARVGLRAQAAVLTRHLSAGQRRRLAIARLISGGHRLWMLDEPFTALDGAGVQLLCELMSEVLEQGVGIVMSSHQSIPLDAGLIDVVDLGRPK